MFNIILIAKLNDKSDNFNSEFNYNYNITTYSVKIDVKTVSHWKLLHAQMFLSGKNMILEHCDILYDSTWPAVPGIRTEYSRCTSM